MASRSTISLSRFDCIARIAESCDVDTIVKFYKEHPSPNVVFRKTEEYVRSVENELFLIVENDQKQMVAGSGVYLLAEGKSIEFENLRGKAQWGVVAEIGSVRRWRGALPHEKGYSGLWHSFLFGVPMILFSQRVGVKPALSVRNLEKASSPNASDRLGELPIDYLVTSVFTTEIDSVNRLQGKAPNDLNTSSMSERKRKLLWPLHMGLYRPADGYTTAFLATTDDPTADRDKYYLKASVGNLPDVARYLQQVIRKGMVNIQGEILTVDMQNLIDKWTLSFNDQGHRATILDKIVTNELTIKQYYEMGWKEWGRLPGIVAPLTPKPLLEVERSGYHRLGSIGSKPKESLESASIIVPEQQRMAGYFPVRTPRDQRSSLQKFPRLDLL